jgi:hypothetical protein
MADDPEMIRLVRQIRTCAVIVAGASLLWVVLTLFPELPLLLAQNRILVISVVGVTGACLLIAWVASVLFRGERS